MLRRPLLVPALLLAAGIVLAGLGRAVGLWGPAGPPGVPRGDQEIAWIHAATSGSAWERFVAGVHRAARDWPGLQVDDTRAFLDQTTATPEVVLGLDGCPGRLHLRWYKLSSGSGNADWVTRLAARPTPPLAFIGGGTSDRALDLARALAAHPSWPGSRPLLLITTATADAIYLDDAAAAPGRDPLGPASVRLMEVYPGRSFRFCFTNEQMAQAVVDFVWSRPELRPFGNPLGALSAVGAAAAGGWAAPAPLAVQVAQFPASVTSFEWDDDPYSIDLSKQFHEALHAAGRGGVLVETRGVPFSEGGNYRPNAWEAHAAEHLIDAVRGAPLERRLLVLPTVVAPARRVLRSLVGAVPLAGRRVVAVSGDAISINNVYRDADILWNVRAVPVPLAFFTHQNPVAWDEPSPPVATGGLSETPFPLLPPNGTDDVLLHAELVRRVAEAAFCHDEGTPPQLLADADALAERLRELKPAFFAPSGDRLGGRGEYVLCLRPQIQEAGASSEVKGAAGLEVWTREPPPQLRGGFGGRPEAPPLQRGGLGRPDWKLIKTLVIDNARGLDAPSR